MKILKWTVRVICSIPILLVLVFAGMFVTIYAGLSKIYEWSRS